MAGGGGHKRLHRLPRSCSKWGMRLPSVARIRTWVLGRVGRLWSQLAPHRSASEIAGVAVDAVRSRRELIIENAALRHQVNVLRRRSKRPMLHLVDRLKLLVGARLLPSWRRTIAIVQPETVLRWHPVGFRLFWRRRSRPRKASPLPSETIDLIRDMAARGRLWGAERIRGELLKLGIKVSKRTIQKYMRGVRSRGGGGQSWATFLKNHAERRTHVGLRLHPDPRPLVPTGLRVLLRAPGIAACRARRRDAPPYPGVDGAAVAQRHDGWGRSGRAAAGSRRQVRGSVRPRSPRRRRQGDPGGGSRTEYEGLRFILHLIGSIER